MNTQLKDSATEWEKVFNGAKDKKLSITDYIITYLNEDEFNELLKVTEKAYKYELEQPEQEEENFISDDEEDQENIKIYDMNILNDLENFNLDD